MSSLVLFISNSILLGVGLAMDAFSVSVANSMANPGMRRGERFRIAGMFAFFQFLMPMIGWLCVHTIVRLFQSFQLLIPWIALILLAYIGGSMVREGLHPDPDKKPADVRLASTTLILQAVATSIDALSVGFAIAEYPTVMAFAASVIIAVVTLFICLTGIRIGRHAGEKLEGKASILGGVILIGIGLEIWISNLFF